MSAPVFTTTSEWRQRPLMRSLFDAVLILVILIIFFSIAFPPMPGGILKARASAVVQQARQIDLMMFSYANDYGQVYPDGKSSTEVFQKLLDGGYATDPMVFYVAMPGKVKPVAGQKLKPENVSWDVTSSVNASSSDLLPLVFMTGYKVNYAPGGTAVPLLKPFPRFGYVDSNPTWFDWLLGRPTIHYSDEGGIAVAYKSNSAMFKKLPPKKNADGSINYPPTYNPDASIPNFVSPDFIPDGKTYRQLTPDGVLP